MKKILIIKNGSCDVEIPIKYYLSNIDKDIRFDVYMSKDIVIQKNAFECLKYDAIIICGGPQTLTNRHDMEYQHKYLNTLICYMRIWVKSCVPVLGICLGAQMISESINHDIYNIQIYPLKKHISKSNSKSYSSNSHPLEIKSYSSESSNLTSPIIIRSNKTKSVESNSEMEYVCKNRVEISIMTEYDNTDTEYSYTLSTITNDNISPKIFDTDTNTSIRSSIRSSIATPTVYDMSSITSKSNDNDNNVQFIESSSLNTIYDFMTDAIIDTENNNYENKNLKNKHKSYSDNKTLKTVDPNVNIRYILEDNDINFVSEVEESDTDSVISSISEISDNVDDIGNVDNVDNVGYDDNNTKPIITPMMMNTIKPMGVLTCGYVNASDKGLELIDKPRNILTNETFGKHLDYVFTYHNDYINITDNGITDIEMMYSKNIPYAFRVCKSYGVQFHPEMTSDIYMSIPKSTNGMIDDENNERIIEYMKYNEDKIKEASQTFFDLWYNFVFCGR